MRPSLGTRRYTLIAAFIGLSVHLSSAMAGTAASDDVQVTGTIKNKLTLRVEDLKAFAPEQITSVTVMRRVDDKETASTVRGVRLTAVLDRAGLASTDRNEWKHTIVMASATDGYRVVFSWSELFNSEAGTGVLLVFERDGQPLAEREGRIALVSAKDIRTGPRSVRWLNRLDVRVLGE